MKKLYLLLVVGVTFCLSGCFTVDSATVKTEQAEHVVMNNWGWKFFNWIPLFCGNASEDAACGTVLFRDDVTMDCLQKRFTAYAKGRQIIDPVYDVKDTVILNVFGIPIPYVFTYNELTLSGTLK